MERKKIEEMQLSDEQYQRFSEIAEKGIGEYVRSNREARGYFQKEICDGICSVATLSRIEAGEKTVDFQIIESLLDRMKIERSEYEFVLDEEDHAQGKKREDIEVLAERKKYKEAEIKLAKYEEEEKDNTEKLRGQFLSFWKAFLERVKAKPDWEKVRKLYLEALVVTAPDYQKKFEQKEILSNLEIRCITEIMNCIRDFSEKEKEFEKLYAYFLWNRDREGFFPAPYRVAMQYYAECLYENGKYDKCIQVCSDALKELFQTSKLENRVEMFCQRAKAREKKGFQDEDEKKLCLRDFLTAYHVTSFYDGEKEAESLKNYIGETYGWQYID